MVFSLFSVTPELRSESLFFLRNEYEGLMDLRKKQNNDSREGSFALSQTLKLRKNGNLVVLGHQKRSFSQNFFYNFFFGNKT